MGDIYAGARKVFAWLGDAIHDSDILFDDLKASLGQSSARLAAPSALGALFERPYWWRVWIVQEIAKAKTVTLFRGSKTIDWDHFVAAIDQPSILEGQALRDGCWSRRVQEPEREHAAMCLVAAPLKSRQSLRQMTGTRYTPYSCWPPTEFLWCHCLITPRSFLIAIFKPLAGC